MGPHTVAGTGHRPECRNKSIKLLEDGIGQNVLPREPTLGPSEKVERKYSVGGTADTHRRLF